MRGLRDNVRGAAALEFALVAPIFLLVLFASFEVGFMTWNYTLATSAAEAVADYLRQSRVAQTTITDTGVRAAACTGFGATGTACSAAKLKIALYDATNPVAVAIPTPTLIENTTVGTTTGDAYIVAVGYEWGVVMPTAKLILPNDGTRAQVQARTYALLLERPID